MKYVFNYFALEDKKQSTKNKLALFFLSGLYILTSSFVIGQLMSPNYMNHRISNLLGGILIHLIENDYRTDLLRLLMGDIQSRKRYKYANSDITLNEFRNLIKQNKTNLVNQSMATIVIQKWYKKYSKMIPRNNEDDGPAELGYWRYDGNCIACPIYKSRIKLEDGIKLISPNGYIVLHNVHTLLDYIRHSNDFRCPLKLFTLTPPYLRQIEKKIGLEKGSIVQLYLNKCEGNINSNDNHPSNFFRVLIGTIRGFQLTTERTPQEFQIISHNILASALRQNVFIRRNENVNTVYETAIGRLYMWRDLVMIHMRHDHESCMNMIRENYAFVQQLTRDVNINPFITEMILNEISRVYSEVLEDNDPTINVPQILRINPIGIQQMNEDFELPE